MKDYNEIAESVLRRRDEYIAVQKKRRRVGVVMILNCLCILVIGGMIILTKGNTEPPIIDETPTDKTVIEIDESRTGFTKEQLIETAEIIIKGKVVKKNSEFMVNPDGTRADADGNVIDNEQITEYTVEIQTLYKGDYDGATINVKTSNGRGLNPDLILYGEDEKSILATELNRLDFEIGEECILLLRYVEGSVPESDGYYPVWGFPGYFKSDGKGSFVNEKAVKQVELSPAVLTTELNQLTSK